MITVPNSSFKFQKQWLVKSLMDQHPFHTGEWQSMDTAAYPTHATHELTDVTFQYMVPQSDHMLVSEVNPDLPWAEEHFQERVSGKPLNPPPSHVNWPYAIGGNGRHLSGEEQKFAHTYPERFWPKGAGAFHEDNGYTTPAHGIRFDYGDYEDVVSQLVKNIHTRQAYLPIWFPEDTGATEGQRVPCTLGYHFLIRNNVLSMRYYMRSCDIYRHFTNDVYFAARLMQHTVLKINESRGTSAIKIDCGSLIMYISSLHAFVGDTPKLKAILEEG